MNENVYVPTPYGRIPRPDKFRGVPILRYFDRAHRLAGYTQSQTVHFSYARPLTVQVGAPYGVIGHSKQLSEALTGSADCSRAVLVGIVKNQKKNLFMTSSWMTRRALVWRGSTRLLIVRQSSLSMWLLMSRRLSFAHCQGSFKSRRAYIRHTNDRCGMVVAVSSEGNGGAVNAATYPEAIPPYLAAHELGKVVKDMIDEGEQCYMCVICGEPSILPSSMAKYKGSSSTRA